MLSMLELVACLPVAFEVVSGVSQGGGRRLMDALWRHRRAPTKERLHVTGFGVPSVIPTRDAGASFLAPRQSSM